MQEKLKVICVLKSGGEYTPEYVHKLKNQTDRMIKPEHTFECLSDIPVDGLSVTPFKRNLPGWWSKLEAFRFTGPALYFDLDTIIYRPLNLLPLMNGAAPAMAMLKPFKAKEDWASGIMYWRHDVSYLFREFDIRDANNYGWDQRYISAKLKEQHIPVKPIQDFFSVESFKKNSRRNGPNADVICFHGRPRPHEVNKAWVKKLWQ